MEAAKASGTGRSASVVARAPSRLAAACVVVVMFAGALLMWAGIPPAWLWLGSRVSASHELKALVYVLVVIGMLASMAGAAWALGRLNRLYYALMGSGRGSSLDPLAVVMVVSVVIAVVAALVWFSFFAECPAAACSSRP